MDDLERRIARMFVIGFDGTSVPADARRLIDGGVAGAILFKRNIESAAQFGGLCAELKGVARRPFVTCVDQEGGRVARLRDDLGFTAVPPMRAVGATGDARLAERIGRLLGREVRAVNVDFDFAPVLDVDTNPANPVIADRSLGATPDVVATMGVAVFRGIQSAGVAACGKHFPGHGDTSQDSHVDLPTLPHTLERLRAVELPPFRAAVDAAVASVMTAHVMFQPLDATYPATMSRPALDGILRDEMHFDGVVVSDDLEMKAIAEHYGLEEAVVRGANAGVDLFLVCHHADVQARAIELLARAVRRGHVTEARVAEAVRRVDGLMAAYVRPPTAVAPGVIGCAEHRAVVNEVAARVEQASLARGRDPTEV